MDSEEIFREQFSGTIEQLKARLEFEAYFAADYLPGSDLAADEIKVKPQIIDDLNQDSLDLPKSIQSDDNKQTRIKSLYQKVQASVLGGLDKTRTNVFFGEGSLDADLVFIGEALGDDADIQSKPFVGLAGGLLTKIINAMQLMRSDVYITNLLCCQSSSTRNPLPAEAGCGNLYLSELLEIIKPKVICTLGEFAVHSLLNETRPLSQLRGQWFEFKGIKLMPTFHPEYLLRNPQEKKLVWDDMRKIMSLLKQYEA
ncbi:MAG: uracil-DNA glycosylase [Candidatus Omnitrophica bacterium]|nr:uracil-DNA glycosylase [Candidatus Omnitrophota bacterium]